MVCRSLGEEGRFAKKTAQPLKGWAVQVGQTWGSEPEPKLLRSLLKRFLPALALLLPALARPLGGLNH